MEIRLSMNDKLTIVVEIRCLHVFKIGPLRRVVRKFWAWIFSAGEIIVVDIGHAVNVLIICAAASLFFRHEEVVIAVVIDSNIIWNRKLMLQADT